MAANPRAEQATPKTAFTLLPNRRMTVKGNTNCGRNIPIPRQHPAQKSAPSSKYPKAATSRKRNRIMSWPWSRQIKIGKNATAHNTHAHQGRVRNSGRWRRNRANARPSNRRFAVSHARYAGKYERKLNGTNRSASKGG